MMVTIDRECLKRLRNGLPNLGALHQPGVVRPHASRRVALGPRRQKNRAANAALRGGSGTRHEVAVEIYLQRVRVAVDIDLLERPARFGWERGRGATWAHRATAR